MAHLLAYNLIRGLMAQAAQEAGLLPWQVSFAGAVQTAVAFAPLAWTAEEGAWEGIARRLLAALAEHRVNDQPGRIEPRAENADPDPPAAQRAPRPRPSTADGKALRLKSAPFQSDGLFVVSSPPGSLNGLSEAARAARCNAFRWYGRFSNQRGH